MTHGKRLLEACGMCCTAGYHRIARYVRVSNARQCYCMRLFAAMYLRACVLYDAGSQAPMPSDPCLVRPTTREAKQCCWHCYTTSPSSPGVGSRAEFASRKACYWSRRAHATASFLWYIASSAYAEAQSHDRLGTIVRRCGGSAVCTRPTVTALQSALEWYADPIFLG